MKTIHVNQSFDLRIDTTGDSEFGGGQGLTTIHITAGVQSVPDAVADHWYTKKFLAHGGLGAPEYATAARAAADAAFVTAQNASELYASLEIAAQEAEKASNMDAVVPAMVRLARPTTDAQAAVAALTAPTVPGKGAKGPKVVAPAEGNDAAATPPPPAEDNDAAAILAAMAAGDTPPAP